MGSNIAALNNHEARQVVLEKQWNNFKGSAAHEAMRQHRLETLLSDPDNFWESIGPDAIKYPFPSSMMGRTELERKSISCKMNNFDNHLARQLAALMITKDDAELGRIIRDMSEQHLKSSVDEWVEENWRNWA